MVYWWGNACLGAKLGHEHRPAVEELTGRLPILLNVLDKLDIQVTDSGDCEGADDIFQQLLTGLFESHEVISMRRAIHNFGECQKEEYEDSASIAK